MQPPTWLPALPNGVQVGVAAGHSAFEVQRMMLPVLPAFGHAAAVVQTVWVIVWAKLPQVPAGVPRPMLAPGAQHTGVAAGQSATGSSHCQSV